MFEGLNPPYDIIYTDPPWWYNKRRAGTKFGAGASRYERMKTKDIAAMPVGDLAAPNCALFMWGVGPRVPDAVEVMRAWGFRYVTWAFVWVKVAKNGEPRPLTGNYTMSNIEVVYLGIRGRMKRVRKDIRQIYKGPILGNHSEKPPEIRTRIERLFGPQRRVELFARHNIPGWDAWGDQVGILD